MIPLSGARLPMISPRSCFPIKIFTAHLVGGMKIFPYEHAILLTGMKSEMNFGF